MKIKAIIKFLESIAPPSYQESYDNSGLIVGNPKAKLTGILLCLDSLEEVIDEAIEKQCNLIVAHHPIVFSGLKSLTGRSYIERIIIKAIKNDIAIYACHTNLDNVKQGVNGRIAERLGLKNVKILDPKKKRLKKLVTFVPVKAADAVRDALFAAGAGNLGTKYSEMSFNIVGAGTFKGEDGANPHVGEVGKRHYEGEIKIEVIFLDYKEGNIIAALHKAHPYEEVAYDVIQLENAFHEVGSGIVGELTNPMEEKAFLQMLKHQMQTDCVRYTALRGERIRKVAVCGGAGSFLLRKAMRAGADIFVTADYKYHQFFDADNKIIIADIGHYESEQFTIDLFYDLITDKFRNFAVFKTEVNTNPIKYL